jgi:soluble lytic murein transglycosylase-like protein
MRIAAGLLVATCLWPSQAAAFTEVELEGEPPAIRRLLSEGAKLANKATSSLGLWRAAVRYCEAARLGSTEAQYQLGMLYAFGAGVPEKRAVAAALFSQAAQQGHYQAQEMLETIPLTSPEVPGCVTAANRLPEKPSRYSRYYRYGGPSFDIEKTISRLPASKIWVVKLVETLAPWYSIDARLALSIISVESNFNPNARSVKNAMGLMQLIPDTAERFNVKDAFNATQNIKAGLQYLRWLLTRYEGDVALAAAGYNAGEGAVDRYRGVPPYQETQQYVQRVLHLYRRTTHKIRP